MKVWWFITGMVVLFIWHVESRPVQRSDSGVAHYGEIAASIQISDCYQSLGLSGHEWVIRNQTQFEELGWLFQPGLDCEGTPFPKIDFEKFTLLGQTTATLCRSSSDRNVYKKDKLEWVYEINIREQGNCDNLRLEQNWVLVPKLADDAKVVFKTSIHKLQFPEDDQKKP